MAEVGLGELGGTGRTGGRQSAAKGAGVGWEERGDVGSWGVPGYTGVYWGAMLG